MEAQTSSSERGGEHRSNSGGVSLEAEAMEDMAMEGVSGCDDKTRNGRGNNGSSKTQGGARAQTVIVDGTEDRGGDEERSLCREDGWRIMQVAQTEKPTAESGGAGQNREAIGQSSGHDPKDKAIVRQVVKQSNKALTGARRMQSRDKEALVTQGERRSDLGMKMT